MQVTVLTAKKQAFDAPLDMPLSTLKGVKVIEVTYGGAGRGLMNKLLSSPHLRKLAKRLNSWARGNAGAGIDPRRAWQRAATDEAMQLAESAHVVVSTFGPAAAHLIACEMKKANPALRWIADYRDLWSQNHTSQITEQLRSELTKAEIASVGTYADLLTVVSDDMRLQLNDLTQKTVLKFPNGFDIDEALVRQRLEATVPLIGAPLRIVYTGMIYRGHRDPTPLLDCLADLHLAGKLNHGTITVDFYGARVDVVEELARNSKFAPFIRLMGHVPREAALQAQREASLLLLLESSEREASGVLTGKIFEYISAGRPILCIGSRPEFEIGQVLSATGTGNVFGPKDREILAGAILQTLNGSGLYATYRPNIEEVMKYSRKKQASDYLVVLQQLIEKF